MVIKKIVQITHIIFMQLQSERYVLHNKYVFNFNIYIFFFLNN